VEEENFEEDGQDQGRIFEHLNGLLFRSGKKFVSWFERL
jgi:hypothetical protein